MAATRQQTGFSSTTQSVGKMVTFAFAEIDNDNVLSNNNQRSFVATDPTLLEHIKAIEDYINANKLNQL